MSKTLCENTDVNNSIRTQNLAAVIPKILEAGLRGNRQRLELVALGAIREFKADFPEMAGEMSKLISKFTLGGGVLRGQVGDPPPVDIDAGFSLIRIEDSSNAQEPILDPAVRAIVDRFVRERVECRLLVKEGFTPPRTLLLKGAPGTGK